MSKQAPIIPPSEDFKNLVDLMAVYSDAATQLEALKADVNQEYLGIIDEQRDAYAKLQKILTESETALELICLKHPDWFTTRKSVKTPYGTVAFRSGKTLTISNEEASIILIEQHIEARRAEGIDISGLLRTRTELNVEALEAMDDDVLARFRIHRTSTTSFSVKPAAIDMGKAVKEAAEQEAA